MSYLHCPTCKRAYNIAVDPMCPTCPVPVSEVDPTEDIITAAEQLARAMARATPSERKDAMTRMDQLALPPGDGAPAASARSQRAKPVTFHGAMLRSIREALEPVAPPPVPKPQPLLAAIAYAVVERISERIQERAPKLLERARGWRARVRALAA